MNNSLMDTVCSLACAGIAGSIAGTVFINAGFDQSTTSAFAGFAGLMGAHTYNFAVLLFVTRYSWKARVRSRNVNG